MTSPTTVSTRTFAVQATQTGLLTQALGIDGATISLMPTQPLKPGKLVQVSATTGTLNLIGESPATPTVWQFRAAAGADGTATLDNSGQRLGSSQTQAVVLGNILALTVDDAYYWPEYSTASWPIPASTPFYAQVDSANAGTSYGAVLETHEITGGAYNNITGLAYLIQEPAAAVVQPSAGSLIPFDRQPP